MVKKIDKKAFTLIEVIVVVAIIGILTLLAVPRFMGQTQKAEEARIQHDVKLMEREIGAELINKEDEFNKWESNSKDLNKLAENKELFDNKGVAEKVDSTDETYKVIPEEYKDKINTKLKGTFYINSGGKVYYDHGEPLVGIPTESGEGPGYSDEEIQDLIKEGYIPVATADELDRIRSDTKLTYGKGTEWEGKYTGGLDKKYVQVKDIDLSGYSEGEGWIPISIFTGTYDGGNYVITDLEINPWEDYYYQGLFGYTQGATISNIALEDVNVIGGDSVGGLVGRADSTVISNSYATGTVTSTRDSVGGLVGRAENSTMISNSYATGTVTGKGDYVGGLVGRADNAVISKSYATGTVTCTRNDASNANSVGGLVGYTSSATIEKSYATGPVTGRGNQVGGLVGNAWKSTIENSYATGSVKGNPFAGGLVGSSGYTTISNSYATGSVDDYYAGGLVASSYNSTIDNSPIENSYWDTETTGQEESKKQDASFGKTTEEMKLKETYKDWDFDTVWEINEGEYPTLR